MKLTIIGASGHGKVVAEIANLCGYDEIEFLDDNRSLKFCGQWPVVGITDRAQTVNNDIFVAIGNAKIRKEMMERLSDKNFPILVHPSAVISDSARLGNGTVVMAGAVINPEARVGRGCIINTDSSIDHDCNVEDYVHVAVASHLCGTVFVGNETWIGAGSIISNNVNVCAGCVLGAGTVVIKDIIESATYIGVPARRLEQ